MSFLFIGGLVADGVSVDTGVLVGGIVLAFATQTIAGWMKLTSLQRDVGGLHEDVVELQVLHPRQGNPGHRGHEPQQRHGGEKKAS